MSALVYPLLITAVLIAIFHSVNGTIVINSDGSWWNDDFQYTNIDDFSIDSWYNPTVGVTDDLGSYTSICTVCGGNVWGWWTKISQSTIQMAHTFFCASESEVRVELNAYFCIENPSDQNVFYFWDSTASRTNNLQHIEYNASTSIWTSIGGSGSKPGTSCTAIIRETDIVDTFNVTSNELITIAIYQETSNVQDNAIAFNNFRIRCTGTTTEPSKTPTKTPYVVPSNTSIDIVTTNSSKLYTVEPTKEEPTTGDANLCDSSEYVGGLSAKMYIVHNYNESNNTNKTITAGDLMDYMTTCKKNTECDIILGFQDDAIIQYNQYIPLYCCFDDANNLKEISIRINSTEFTKCIDDEIDDDTTTLIEGIHIWLKSVHEMYFKFAIPDFMVFMIILIVMSILMILTMLNWIHSKGSYCLCCWCSMCGCMAADEARLGILFIVSFRIGDMITDGLISYNIYRYYMEFERNNVYMFVLTIINACSLILPYFIINIWTMISVSKLNTNTDRLTEWFRKYKCRILFISVVTGDFYVALLLFTSNMFGIDLFDSGLSSSHLINMRKFKIATIIFENIPQMITQSIFGWYTDDFQVVAMSLIFSLSVNIGNVIAWFINKNFDKTCAVYDYYIEVKISQNATFKFNDDVTKIKRYSKCRKRVRNKLVNIIRENTSSVQCQVYYIEMIGTGCNIHITHYLTENTKIRTDSTGSIPVSDVRKYTNIDAIMQIYDGKYQQIEEELEKLWHLKGKVFVYLRLHQDDYLPNQSNLQMSLQNQVSTNSNVYH